MKKAKINYLVMCKETVAFSIWVHLQWLLASANINILSTDITKNIYEGKTNLHFCNLPHFHTIKPL